MSNKHEKEEKEDAYLENKEIFFSNSYNYVHNKEPRLLQYENIDYCKNYIPFMERGFSKKRNLNNKMSI